MTRNHNKEGKKLAIAINFSLRLWVEDVGELSSLEGSWHCISSEMFSAKSSKARLLMNRAASASTN